MVFPSWFSFLTYGPFVPKDKRLSSLEIIDASKKVGKSRAEKRKIGKLEKDVKRSNDDTSDRGFTTDQKLQLELINLTRQQTTDRTRESKLMGLCVQETAIAKQIDRAERTAERMAPNDIENPYNIWWKKVNNLLKEQESIITQMALLNKESSQPSLGGSQNSRGSNPYDITLTNKLGDTSSSNNELEEISDLSQDQGIQLNHTNSS